MAPKRTNRCRTLYSIIWSYVQLYGHNVEYSPVRRCTTTSINNGYCGISPIPLRQGGQNIGSFTKNSGVGWQHLNYEHLHDWSFDPLIFSSLASFNNLMQGLTAPNVVGHEDTSGPSGYDKTLYYLKFINSSYTKQYAIILVVVGMRPNGEWGIITAYPTFVNTGMSWWNHKSQFPDWMANYGEFGGQVTGPYNLSGFPNP